jgi:hypothetical protein
LSRSGCLACLVLTTWTARLICCVSSRYMYTRIQISGEFFIRATARVHIRPLAHMRCLSADTCPESRLICWWSDANSPHPILCLTHLQTRQRSIQLLGHYANTLVPIFHPSRWNPLDVVTKGGKEKQMVTKASMPSTKTPSMWYKELAIKGLGVVE